MKKIATTVRCVPRFGYEYSQVREVDIDLPEGWDDEQLRVALSHFFAYRSISDAVFAIDADDDGFLPSSTTRHTCRSGVNRFCDE